MSGKPVLVRHAIMCGCHYDVWLSAADARTVVRWSAILLPVYAAVFLGFFALLAFTGAD